MGRQLTTEEFVAKARSVHGDKYDYSKVEYKGRDVKVEIICLQHGVFLQTPHNHLRGQKCPKCAIQEKMSTTEKFITKAREMHGDKYDYSLVEYMGSRAKVNIICPKHGVFLQTPDAHTSGSICPICANEAKMNTLEHYIQLSIDKHGDKYDFSSSVYLGVNKEIQVTCKKCRNVFNITPLSLIAGKGCRTCDFSDDRRVYCLDGEEWRDINGFDGYQVSNMGRIRSVDRIINVGKHKRRVSGMIMKLLPDKDGYVIVSFKTGGDGKAHRKRVHRIVAEAFIENINNYDCVDHINGIRNDNRVENLRWCTVKMNANYELATVNRSKAIKLSYVKNPNLRQIRSEKFSALRRMKVEVIKDGISLGIFDSQTEAAAFLGIRQSRVSAYVNGKVVDKNGITINKL